MFLTPNDPSRKLTRFLTADPAILLSILYFFLLLPWLGKNRLLGLDESIYADMALYAARHNQFWPLIFHDQPFWDKPPFYIWLQTLSVICFGATEMAVRIWTALAASLSVFFVVRLGTVLGNSVRVGVFCGLLLILQGHFLLYSRIGTLDMFLLACLLGAWWQLTKAFNPPSHDQADRELLFAGLWLLGAVMVKSWHGFVLLPALGLALLFCRPWPFTPKQVFYRLFLPPILFMATWITVNIISFGGPYLKWAWGYDLMGRASGGGFGSLASLNYHVDFYGILLQHGMAFLWPVLPLCAFLWVREEWSQSAQGRFDATHIIGSSFYFYYAFTILFFVATLINYLLPLVPLAVLSTTFLFRLRDDKRVLLAACVAMGLGVWNGLGHPNGNWILEGSFACIFLLALPSSWGFRREWFGVLLMIWMVLCAYKLQSYWRNPPDPNRVWVLAILEHPAEYSDEKLYFVGEETDARVLAFYSDYHVVNLSRLPNERPIDGALLFRNRDQVVYLPIPRQKLLYQP